MSRLIKSIIFMFFVISQIKAQNIYVGDKDGFIYKINLDNCHVEFVTETSPFRDITFDVDNKLIGIINRSIQEIDTVTGNPSEKIHSYQGNPMIGLTSSNDGHYLGASVQGQILSYDPKTENEVLIYTTKGYIAGDISFRNQYIIASGTNDRITQINTYDTTDIKEFNFGGFDGAINGLSSTWHDCEMRTFCSVTKGGLSTIYELDFESLDTIPICKLDFTIYGSTFKNEHLCSLDSIDLQQLCIITSSSLGGPIQKSTIVYPNPTNSKVFVNTERGDGYLYDLGGKILERFIKINEDFSIDLSTYDAGVYFLKLQDEVIKIIRI